MKTVLLALGLILCASSVQAQTHPCDQPDLSTQGQQQSASSVPFSWQVCMKPAENPQAIIVVVNGTPRSPTPLVAGTTTTPNAEGYVPYVATLTLPKGSYQIDTRMQYRDIDGSLKEGPLHTPFALGVADPIVPSATKNVKK